MPSYNTYRLTWVSLTLGVGYLFMAAPAKCSHCSLPWRRGISSPLPFLTFNVGSSSRPSCAQAATAPWMWGWSSQPQERQCQRMLKLPHNCTHLITATLPDLQRGIAPLGSLMPVAPWTWGWSSRTKPYQFSQFSHIAGLK